MVRWTKLGLRKQKIVFSSEQSCKRIIQMAFGEDWLGWTIIVFIIVTIIIIVIKMLIEYPGLTELKCVYKDKDSADNDDLESIGEYYQDRKSLKVSRECQ